MYKAKHEFLFNTICDIEMDIRMNVVGTHDFDWSIPAQFCIAKFNGQVIAQDLSAFTTEPDKINQIKEFARTSFGTLLVLLCSRDVPLMTSEKYDKNDSDEAYEVSQFPPASVVSPASSLSRSACASNNNNNNASATLTSTTFDRSEDEELATISPPPSADAISLPHTDRLSLPMVPPDANSDYSTREIDTNEDVVPDEAVTIAIQNAKIDKSCVICLELIERKGFIVPPGCEHKVCMVCFDHMKTMKGGTSPPLCPICNTLMFRSNNPPPSTSSSSSSSTHLIDLT